MIEWIITSSFLIAVTLLMRAIVKNRISSRLRYALWLIVLIRLLVPVTVSESPLSVLNVFELLPRQIVSDIESAATLPITPLNQDAFASVDTVNDGASAADLSGGADNNGVSDTQNGNKTVNPLTAAEILSIVWLAGAGILCACLIITNVSFAVRLRRTRKKIDAVGFKLPVYIVSKLPTPCLFGFVKPSVYVTPTATANKKCLSHVLAHEYTHYRHLDFIWSVLRGAALCLHWYNPLVWYSAIVSKRDCELACDEATLVRIGESERIDYGRTLIGLILIKNSPADLLCSATTMVSGKRGVKERITMISKKPKILAAAIAAVIIVFAAATGCSFTGAVTDDTQNYERFGLTVELPDDYGGKVTASDPESIGDNIIIELYHDESVKASAGGWMYSIVRHTADEFVPENDNAGGLQYFAKGGGYYYAVMSPTDVETDPSDAEMSAGYSALCDEKGTVKERFITNNSLAGYTVDDYINDSAALAHSEPALLPASGEALIAEADFGGDGTAEQIYADFSSSADGWYYLTVKSGGAEIYRGEANTSHAGWMSYYLTEYNGAPYLLIYNEYSAQGASEYSYSLFVPGGETVDVNSVYFELEGRSEFDVNEMLAFKDTADGYLAGANLLLSTEDGTATVLTYNAPDTTGYSVDYSFVDSLAYLYDDSTTLAEKLQIYSDYMHEYFMIKVAMSESEVNSTDCIHGAAYSYPDYHNIPESFWAYVGYDTFYYWLDYAVERSRAENDADCLYKYVNIVDFIRDYNIPREDFDAMYYETNLYYTNYYDADIIYNGTAEEIEAFFSAGNEEHKKVLTARSAEVALKTSLISEAGITGVENYYTAIRGEYSVAGLITASGINYARLNEIVTGIIKQYSWMYSYDFDGALDGVYDDMTAIEADEAMRGDEIVSTTDIVRIS